MNQGQFERLYQEMIQINAKMGEIIRLLQQNGNGQVKLKAEDFQQVSGIGPAKAKELEKHFGQDV